MASISDTIFEHLDDAQVSWRCFEHYYSFIRRFERYTFDSEHVLSYDDETQGFKALAASGDLPAVSFIEPHYVDYPPNSFCDEPPSDIRNSQPFIRDLPPTRIGCCSRPARLGASSWVRRTVTRRPRTCGP